VSTAAAPPHDALLPRAPGGNGPGALLALAVHAALIAALTISVNWRSPPSQIVAAELWSAVPQAAAPRAIDPAPTLPAVPPAPPPRAEPAPPPPAPAQPDAQIAVEKAKKAAEDKERSARLEREKQLRERAEREKLDKERAEREQAQRAKAERELAQREKAEREAEDRRSAQQREENLRRMMGQIAGAASGTGAPTSRGTAAVDAAPSQAYAARLHAAIFPNIVFTEAFTGNPAAEVEVRAAPNGSIISRRIVKPSGNREWDEAVLRAIDRTATLPRDTDGRVPPALTITFRPSKN